MTDLHAELAAIYALYAAIAAQGQAGGKLLYVGKLDQQGSRLMRAANIAGAASLGATADPALQRQAIREGAADFLVTNLDEALRILKNEIRKRQTVAVCVAAAPEAIEAEMQARGVQPDLLPPNSDMEVFLSQGAVRIEPAALPANQVFIAIEQPPADWEPKALALIPESDQLNRRWLRLSPRYLGPHVRRIRSLACEKAIADQLTSEP